MNHVVDIAGHETSSYVAFLATGSAHLENEREDDVLDEGRCHERKGKVFDPPMRLFVVVQVVPFLMIDLCQIAPMRRQLFFIILGPFVQPDRDNDGRCVEQQRRKHALDHAFCVVRDGVTVPVRPQQQLDVQSQVHQALSEGGDAEYHCLGRPWIRQEVDRANVCDRRGNKQESQDLKQAVAVVDGRVP